MRAKKKFLVVAYDITDDKRRKKVTKVLFRYGGVRVNFSVMELSVTEQDCHRLIKEISDVILQKEDTVIFYSLDVNSFSKIVYLRKNKGCRKSSKIKVV